LAAGVSCEDRATDSLTRSAFAVPAMADSLRRRLPVRSQRLACQP